MKISDEISFAIRCPKCMSAVTREDEMIICLNPICKTVYPIVNGIPVLINEENSVFKIKDFTENNFYAFKKTRNKIRRIIDSLTPPISKNIKAEKNYSMFTQLLLTQSSSPKVLIIGGSISGHGTDPLLDNPLIDFFETDVSFGPRTKFIVDSHNIPFKDEYFDGVVIQAVLEHVIDPFRCVKEIYRILKKNGYVYAETPFMQQVHMGRYDFHRFTHLGHRRLFRNFSEIESGAVCGPGMALAWSYKYFINSFFKSTKIRSALYPFIHFTSFFLKYFDHYLVNKPGAYDAASGYYFLGQKNSVALPDTELLKLYKGLF
jgi:SAM-dependent methyltransferase